MILRVRPVPYTHYASSHTVTDDDDDDDYDVASEGSD